MENTVFTEEMDGINNAVESNKVTYILLATKPIDKPFCMFYVTDGYQDFWLARFEITYFK